MAQPKRSFSLSATETRSANTTAAAWHIVKAETAERETKIKRLRLARLDRDDAARVR